MKIIQTVYSPHEPQPETTPNTKTSLGTNLTLHTIKYQSTTTHWWATEMFPPLAAHYDNDDEDEFFSVLPVTGHIPLAIPPLMIHKFSSLFKNLTHNSKSLCSLWVSTRWSLKTHLRDSQWGLRETVLNDMDSGTAVLIWLDMISLLLSLGGDVACWLPHILLPCFRM